MKLTINIPDSIVKELIDGFEQSGYRVARGVPKKELVMRVLNNLFDDPHAEHFEEYLELMILECDRVYLEEALYNDEVLIPENER